MIYIYILFKDMKQKWVIFLRLEETGKMVLSRVFSILFCIINLILIQKKKFHNKKPS